MKKVAARSIAVALVGAIAGILAVSATATTRSAAAERIPLTCVANLNDTTGLTAGFLAPDTPPYFDIVPPIGSYAGATGYGVFTPSGRMNIVCSQNSWIGGGPDWGGTSFTGEGDCYLSRGGDSEGHGTSLFTGHSTVTIHDGRVDIRCHGSLADVAP